jgi:hypothetical protein
MSFLKGIHKTGPRPDVDVFGVAAQVNMHAQLSCKIKIKGASLLTTSTPVGSLCPDREARDPEVIIIEPAERLDK